MKIYRHAIVAGLLSLLLVLNACTNGGSNGSGNDTASGPTGGTSGGTGGGGTADGGTSGTLEAVPFHGNQEQIKGQMAKIPGAAPDMTVSNEYGSTLNWVGGRFEGLPVDQWGFSFYRGQMLYASLHFTTETSKLDADRLYDTVSAVVTGRHGGMIMDSKNLASRALIGYSEADQFRQSGGRWTTCGASPQGVLCGSSACAAVR